MDIFIETLIAFFDSDLADSELAVRIVIVVVAFLLGAGIVALIHRFIINQVIHNNNAKLKEENEELKKEIKRLNGENKKYKEKLEKYQKQIDMDELNSGDTDDDVAVMSFLPQK